MFLFFPPLQPTVFLPSYTSCLTLHHLVRLLYLLPSLITSMLPFIHMFLFFPQFLSTLPFVLFFFTHFRLTFWLLLFIIFLTPFILFLLNFVFNFPSYSYCLHIYQFPNSSTSFPYMFPLSLCFFIFLIPFPIFDLLTLPLTPQFLMPFSHVEMPHSTFLILTPISTLPLSPVFTLYPSTTSSPISFITSLCIFSLTLSLSHSYSLVIGFPHSPLPSFPFILLY